MASGRPDYLISVSPIRTILGNEQLQIVLSERFMLASLAIEDFITYTVPDNYLFYITSFQVSCQQPGVRDFYPYVNDTPGAQIYFDTLYLSVHDSNGLMEIKGGDIFKIRVYNNDTIPVAFSVYVYGYIDYIKS